MIKVCYYHWFAVSVDGQFVYCTIIILRRRTAELVERYRRMVLFCRNIIIEMNEVPVFLTYKISPIYSCDFFINIFWWCPVCKSVLWFIYLPVIPHRHTETYSNPCVFFFFKGTEGTAALCRCSIMSLLSYCVFTLLKAKINLALSRCQS